jgi:pyrroloquinoline quinone (PQQ) biosynthesis protein C
VQTLEAFRTDNVRRIQSTNLVKSILEGKPTKQHYMGYLIDVYHYAQHSPTVIALAGSRCIQTHPQLGQYLFRHASEEVGHEQWALSDLKDCGMPEERIPQLRPTAACMLMIALEYYVAGTWNPVALFGWLYALESLGDAMGMLLSRSLGQGLQLGDKAVYFLEGHGEADHHHTRDLEEQITTYVTDPKGIDDLFYVVQISSDLYARMVRGGSGNSDSVLSGSLASPKPPAGGEPEERGNEENETQSRGIFQGPGGLGRGQRRQDAGRIGRALSGPSHPDHRMEAAIAGAGRGRVWWHQADVRHAGSQGPPREDRPTGAGE